MTKEEWRVLTKRVVGYAFSRTKDLAQSHDLAQSAVMRAFDADKHVGWNPEAKTLMQYLMGEVNSLLYGERKHRRQHREIATSTHVRATSAERAAAAKANEVASDAPPTDEELASRRARADKWKALRDWFVSRDDPAALDVIGLFEDGIDGVDEQARACARSTHDIARARERIMDRARKTAREEEAS